MMTEGRVCMVAVDGSKHAEIALNWYMKYIYRTGDQILIVNCVDHREAFTYGTTAMVPGNPDAITHAYAMEEKKSHDLLKKIQEQIMKQGKTCEVATIRGEAGHAIVKAAEDYHANMIVTGSRGISQLRRTILGSISDYVIHHSHVPVIVCRHD